MKKSLLLALAFIIVGTTLLGSASSAAVSVNWLQARRDNQRSGFNAFETTITPSTIAANPTQYGFGIKVVVPFAYRSPTVPVIYKNVMYTYAPRILTGQESTPDLEAWALYAMDAITGALKWKTDIDCAGTGNSPAIDVTANVILISMSSRCNSESHGGALVAVDLTTHAIRWSLGSDNGGSAPAVVNGTAYLTTSGEGGGNLVSRSMATGALYWSAENGYQTPSVGNGVVYTAPSPAAPVVGTSLIYAYGGLKAYTATTGALRWSRPCPTGICAFSTTGVLRWNAPTGSGVSTLANGVLYMTCDVTWLCAVNATTGAPVWRFDVGGPASTTVAGGIIYFTVSGTFGMLNSANGALIDKVYDEWWRIGASAAPVVNNGRVYVVNENRINIFGLCTASVPFTYC